VGLLSRLVPTLFVDLRPPDLALAGMSLLRASITQLPFADHSISSVSSLCVVEHIGLGRYGDPIDPQGAWKAMSELKRVLAVNGDLFISVPVSNRPRVFFNAHRAFTEEQLQQQFAPLRIVDRSYIVGTRPREQLDVDFAIGCYHFKH
jgi:hypothetical protein